MSFAYVGLCKLTSKNSVHVILSQNHLYCDIKMVTWENVSLIILYGNRSLFRANSSEMLNIVF